MRLYPKKLHNIKELEREKKLLNKQSRELGKEKFFSLEGMPAKGKRKDKEKERASLVDLLPIPNPYLKIVLKMLEGRLMKSGNGRKTAEEKPPKDPLKMAVVEFAGGYLKWKAIELSYKGIKHFLRNRKERANAQKLNASAVRK